MNDKPIWSMIVEAVDHFQREVGYSEIKDYILSHWPEINRDTITYQIIAITVNHPSRVHYPENRKPRVTNGSSNYDRLYYKSRGRVEKYNRQKHGLWELYQDGPQIKIRLVDAIPGTFLFVWNPKHWPWDYIEESIEKLQYDGICIEPWSCGNTKKIKKGDRFFLVRVTEEPRGIVASGFIQREVYEQIHWQRNKPYNCVDLAFDTILNPTADKILTIEQLTDAGLNEQHWTPQGSGITIKEEYVPILEKLWFNIISTTFTVDEDADKEFFEGKHLQIIQNRYERNPFARKKCLEHYGYDCIVCSLNFELQYGEIGREFIHVHHKHEISKQDGRHKVNPIIDLVPVCPNCHAMLHKRTPPFEINTIKQLIKKPYDE